MVVVFEKVTAAFLMESLCAADFTAANSLCNFISRL